MFIFTFNKELSHKILVGNIGNDFFDFVGRSHNKELDDLLFLMTNIIYHGDIFSIEKLDLTPEIRARIQELSRSIFSGLYYSYSSIRRDFINYIRTMNMLSING